MKKGHQLLRKGISFCLLLPILLSTGFDNVSDKYDIETPSGMVYIEEGMSLLGAEEGDLNAKNDAKPRHPVYLKSYYIDTLEVTNGAYAECVAAGVCAEPADTSSATRANYYDVSTFQGYPVVNVTWDDAQTYCEFVGKRLPTEAEWEKAAMGTIDYRRYPWGNGEPKAYLINVTDIPGDTETVNSYPTGSSPYGLVDTAGNVSEWVSDWYATSYYAESVLENPTGPDSGTHKVVRGDSWLTDLDKIHITNRTMMDPETYNATTGFRCAKDVKEKVYYETPVSDENSPDERAYAVVNSGHDSGIFLLTEPGKSQSIIVVASNGSLLEVLEGPVEINYTDWYLVRTGAGKEGWTIGSSLSFPLK